MHRMGAFLAARAVAARQQGVVTVEQLGAAGVTRRQIARGVERGELRRLRRGVYLLGTILFPYSLEAAAVLVCGRRAALSHRSSTELYKMLPRAGGHIHVTVPGPVRREHEGIVVHATSSLEHYEVRERHGIPVTSPIRTLVDLAATATDQELEQAVAEAFALRLTTLPSLQRATTAYRGRRGIQRLRALLDAEPRHTRSPPERILLRGIREAKLPEPETNVKLHGWEVDFFWREAGLVVEVDGYATHSSPRAFERDRRKDAELTAYGLTVQRFTADRVRRDLDSVLEWLDAATVKRV